MDRLSSHRATKEVVNKHNFKFSKSLGQNFLIDDNVIDRILEGARLSETDKIIEVGPGIGTLTREMGKVAENVVSIEIDKTLIPILKETLADLDNVEVVSFNGLLVDLAKKNDARVILKGLRAVSDFEYEFQMALMNSQLDSEVETLFMTTSAANSFLSSSSVKQVAKFGGKINGLVPDEIVDDVIRKIKG